MVLGSTYGHCATLERVWYGEGMDLASFLQIKFENTPWHLEDVRNYGWTIVDAKGDEWITLGFSTHMRKLGDDIVALVNHLTLMQVAVDKWDKLDKTLAIPLVQLQEQLQQKNAAIELMLPSARLVSENGGYSGSSGNWPLVSAYDKLQELEKLQPELYARIKEREVLDEEEG